VRTSPTHRSTRRVCVVLLFLILGATQAIAGTREIGAIALTVSDLARSVDFFTGALGFTKVSERTTTGREQDLLVGVFATRVRSVELRLGDETIVLEQYVAPGGRPIPLDSRSPDLWFQHFAIVVSDMERAVAHLGGFPIRAISAGPQTIPESNVAAAGIKAFKFRDPDGHPLELLWFPPDKGKRKWQEARDALFLGIDHSAIAVSDTARSLAFYRDILGMRVAGGTLNQGPTQEQLDATPGAVVRITGLQVGESAGPGVEFLQYLTPADGRPAPADIRANDLVATRLVIRVDDLQSLVERLQEGNVTFVSPEPVRAGPAASGRGLMVKDPDGHALLLVE